MRYLDPGEVVDAEVARALDLGVPGIGIGWVTFSVGVGVSNGVIVAVAINVSFVCWMVSTQLPTSSGVFA